MGPELHMEILERGGLAALMQACPQYTPEFIVLACSAHEQLVAALRELIAQGENAISDDKYGQNLDTRSMEAAIRAGNEALAAAGAA